MVQEVLDEASKEAAEKAPEQPVQETEPVAAEAEAVLQEGIRSVIRVGFRFRPGFRPKGGAGTSGIRCFPRVPGSATRTGPLLRSLPAVRSAGRFQ